MAFTPYFRYETTSLDFGAGIYAPSFPVPLGLSLHSYPTQKPTYTITNRLHGTTNINWRTEDIQQTDRDTIYDFWNTTLSEGYYDFTVIDNRSRMLFESSWNDWEEQWTKRNGGLYTIGYNLESSIPWTPPVWGAYLMADDSLDNHTLQGSNLSADDGTIVDYATDTNITRLNGSALRLTGNTGSQLTGASSVVSWDKSSLYNNMSLFCQIRMSAVINSGRLYVMYLSSNANIFSISIQNASGANGISGYTYNNGSSADVSKGSGTYHELTNDTWYDVAFTHDAVNSKSWLYVIESGSTFTDFLSGTSTEDEQIGEYNSTEVNPIDRTYTAARLLYESTANVIDTSEYAYIQNAMFLEGYLTPFDFNTLRRLCFMWNSKTAVYPK